MMATRDPDLRPSPFRLTLTLTLTLMCAMTLPGRGEAFYYDFGGGRGNNYYGNDGGVSQLQQQQQRSTAEMQQLKQRVAQLESLLQQQQTRLQVAEQVVTDIGRQACAAGEAILHKCSGNQMCVTSLEQGTQSISNNQLTIPFTTPFMVAPVLQLTTDASDNTCSDTVHLHDLSHLTFTLTLTSDTPTTPCPLPLHLRWFACPAAIFQGDQGLPLPLDPATPEGSMVEPEPPEPEAVSPEVFHGPRVHSVPDLVSAIFGGWGGEDWSEDDDK